MTSDHEVERVGQCGECYDGDIPVRPHEGDGWICSSCAADIHEWGRTTAWWEGPPIALPPLPPHSLGGA